MTPQTPTGPLRLSRAAGLRDPSVWVFAALVGVGYAVVAAVSLALVSETHGVAVLWPAAGIAAGAMIVARPAGRVAVAGAVALAVLAVNLWFGAGPVRSLVFAVVNTTEAALCAWVFLRLHGGQAVIDRPGDVLRLVLAAGLGTGVAAGIGVLLLAQAGTPAILSVAGWWTWMRADLVGVLTFAPVFLARWTARDLRRARLNDLVLDGAAILGLAGVSWLLLAGPALDGSVLRDVPLASIMPALLWIGIRRSIPAAAWAGLGVAGITTLTTIGGIGLFGDALRLSDPVGAGQMFMVVCSLSLLTLATVFSDRQRSQTMLDNAEERQRITIEGVGGASWDLDIASGAAIWSPAHFDLLGLPRDPQGRGRREVWRARIHPADLPHVEAAFQASIDGRIPYEAEYRIIRADTGEERWLSDFGRVLPAAQGTPLRGVGIILDVTARHDSQRTDAFLLRLEDALRGLSSAAEIERTAATHLGREIGAGRVFYACIEAERFGTVGPNYTDGMAPIEGRFDVATFGAAVLEGHRRGETMMIADVATRPDLDDGERGAFTQIGVRSAVTANLRKDGRWVASFSAQRPDAHHWTSGERALVEALAERTWAAVARVHAERALALSEARFRALFDEAGIGMVLMDRHYRIQKWNTAYARIVGRESVDLSGMDPLGFTHPGDVAMQRDKIAVLRAGPGRGMVFEKRYLHPDDTSVWVRANLSLLASGEVLAVIEDVSDRILAETELRRLNDSVPAFVYRSAPNGTLLSVNRRWTDYTGQTIEVARVDGTMGLIHPDDAPGLAATFARAVADRTAFAFEFRCRRHDGAYRWFYALSEPDLDDSGAVTGWFGTSTDIHDRKSAEADRAIRDRRDGFLLRLQDQLRVLDDPVEVGAAASEMLGRELRAGRVFYAELDDAAGIATIGQNFRTDGATDAAGTYALDDFHAAMATLKAGLQLVVTDARRDARLARHILRPEIVAMQVEATLDTPLMRDGQVVGMLAINHPEPRVWTSDEISLAQDVAERTWAVMERLRAQNDLRAKTEELELLVESAPLGVAFFDRDHRYLRINEELAETNGLPVAAHLGRTIEDVRPGVSDAVGALLDQVFRTGETVRDLEVPGETPQAPGIQRYWLTNFYPVRTASGDITSVGVWVIDITARKNAEIALRDSEARLRAVIEAVPVGLVFADATGRITGGNALVEQLLAHPVLTVSGQDHYNDYVGFHADGRRVAGTEYPLARAFAGEERPELEVHYQRGDGRRAWLRFVAGPIRDSAGGMAGAVVASVDIDRERRIETELRELNADLERRVADAVAQREGALNQLHEAQKIETIGQLTGGVAHDFNNLLAAILSNLDLLRKHATDQRSAQLIEGAVRGAERGAALTKRLLAFARRQDLKAERVDLDHLVAGMQDLLARSLGPGIRIETRMPPDLPPVSVDPNQLELALLNLAVNARDAMPDGGTLTVAGQAHAGWPDGMEDGPQGAAFVCIRVSDTGQGMDVATRRRATEPFFTTKGVGKGTGLGLSMVQGLAAQSGGTMRIESAPGLGTTIELWLPQATDADADVAVVVPHAADPGAVAPSPSLRILVVDDDILVAMGTAAMLEDLGHAVIEVHSGARALEIIADTPDLDLVVTDHAMPGMTGAELARRVRKVRPLMPIVLATGYAELPDGEDAELPRLAKPFRQEELSAILDRVMPQARAISPPQDPARG